MNFFLETYGFTYLLCSKRYIKEGLGFLTETYKTKNKEYVKRFWVRQLYQEHKLNVELNLLVHNMKLYDSKPFFLILWSVSWKTGNSSLLGSSTDCKKGTKIETTNKEKKNSSHHNDSGNSRPKLHLVFGCSEIVFA